MHFFFLLEDAEINSVCKTSQAGVVTSVSVLNIVIIFSINVYIYLFCKKNKPGKVELVFFPSHVLQEQS